jgi:two-component sensor histidine kinase
LNSYITQLVRSIAHSYGYGKDDIELSFEVTDEPIDVDLAIPLGLIANELVSNSFKHAYKDVVSPKLHVALVKEEDLLLLVKDNGPGFKKKGEDIENLSFGMELVQSLSKQLKATLDYQFEAGTVVRMTIPKATLTKSNV